jgi:hypothetical protein
MDLRTQLERLTAKPHEAIQGINALALSLYGLWAVSPYFIPDPNAASGEGFLYSNAARIIFSVIWFILPAVPTFLGWFSARFRTQTWRSRSCFLMFIGVVTLLCIALPISGFFPPVWLFYLAVGLTSAILYLHWKVKT